jgi:hypothetical protein
MLSGGRLDGRTSLHKVLREKEQELITALGGDPSPQERDYYRRCRENHALRRHAWTSISCGLTAAL